MYCPKCGKEIDDEALICPHCGVATSKYHEAQSKAQPNVVINNTNENINTIGVGVSAGVSMKSKTVTLILAIFLGYFGVHRFYVGKAGTGIIWLLTVGLFGFGWIADIIAIVMNRFTDKNGLPVVR